MYLVLLCRIDKVIDHADSLAKWTWNDSEKELF